MVLLDQSLPDITGLEFYERLKAGGYDLPVIMVTGLSDEATVVEALRAGVSDFVTKSPEYLDYLPKAVERVVAQARLERRLEESEEKYRSIFENAVEGIYQASLDGRLLTANPAMARIFGYGSPEEMISAVSDTTTQLWVSAEERAGYVRRLQEKGAIAGLETRMKRKDGSMTWVSANMRALRNSDGDMVALEGTLEDISERKRIEEALRDSEAFSRSTLNSLSAQIAIVDESGTILAVNKTWRDFAESNGGTGQKVAEGANYLQVCDSSTGAWSEGVAVFAEGLRSVLSGQREEFAFEYPCHSPTERRWFVARVTRFSAGGLARAVVAHEDITEGKQAEEVRLLLASIVECSNDVIFSKTLDGAITSWNASARKLYGYSEDEILGRHVSLLVPPDHTDEIPEILEKVRRGETVDYHETVRITKDGRKLDVSITVSPIKDSEGRIAGASVIGRDITERKRAEERIYFQAHLLGAVGQAVIATDLQGRITYWNQAAEKLYGWPADEVMGRFIIEVTPSEELKDRAEEIMSELRAGKSWSGEFLLQRRDGTLFPALVTDTPVQDERRKLVGIIGVSTDITERKRDEEALRESEARHFAVVNLAFDAIVTMTSDGNIEAFNEEAENVFGYETAEVVGQPVTVLMPERFREKHRAGLSHYLKGGASRFIGQRRIELTGQRKDGVEFPLELSLAEVRGGGNPLFTAILRDITERKRAEERLRYQAFHDSLTNLANRQLFVDRLERALARAERLESIVAVLFMDLDNFKNVNDSLGHEVGDQLLVAIAERFKSCLRPEDMLARFGGDELVILLEDVESPTDAGRVAERIIEELRKPFYLNGHEIFTSASIGISVRDSADVSVNEMLRNADTAMYHAKRKDSGSSAMFEPAMHIRILRRLKLEQDLRQAVARGQFKLHYQPLVDIKSGGIIGTEALVRWEHPERGLLSPNEFIPVAEETGLIVPLGKWVLAEACRQACAWRSEFATPLKMNVNLSVRQFQHPDLVEDVAEVLRRTALEPACLSLEITESMAMVEPERTAAMLRELRELGLRLAIDDFGTGHSSLAYLIRQFRMDILKIDRSFIGEVANDPEYKTITSGIVGMARSLNLEVIAEGIETAEQYELLQSMGCDTGQGYFFSRPLPGEALSALLSRNPRW